MSWGGAAPNGHMEVGSNAHASTALYFAGRRGAAVEMTRKSALQLAEWVVERTAQREHFDAIVRNGIRGRHLFSRAEKGGGALEALLESIGITGREWHARIVAAMDEEVEAARRAAAEGEEERLARLAAEAEERRQQELDRMRARAQRKAESMGRGDDTWLVEKLFAEELAEVEKREAKKRREAEEAAAAAALAAATDERAFAGEGVTERVQHSVIVGERPRQWAPRQRGVRAEGLASAAHDGETTFGMPVFYNQRSGASDIVSPAERARIDAEDAAAEARAKEAEKQRRRARRMNKMKRR